MVVNCWFTWKSCLGPWTLERDKIKAKWCIVSLWGKYWGQGIIGNEPEFGGGNGTFKKVKMKTKDNVSGYGILLKENIGNDTLMLVGEEVQSRETFPCLSERKQDESKNAGNKGDWL